MNSLTNENTGKLIELLLSNGNDYTCDYIAKLFNDNLSKFNEFIIECQSVDEDKDKTYRIEEFEVSDLNRLNINELCINWKWSTTRNGFKEYHGSTHGLIRIESNSIELFNFGPNTKANNEHREWLDNMLSREYKFNQLKITN